MESEITFESLGLNKNTLEAVKKKGFTTPSEIQARIIPLVLENKHDIIGISHTGSGKTASFGLPLIDLISEDNRSPKAIILAPTRELALQVTDELKTYQTNKKLKMTTVYGGTSISNQIKDLKKGIDIVVGTPGRVLDLIDRKSLDLSCAENFILDEADEMLRMGFIEDIELIFERTPKNRRVLLFSATMPEKIKKLTKKYMKNQVIVEIKKKQESKANIEQKYFFARRSEEKFNILTNIMDMEDFFYGIIFCRTKADVDELASSLKKAGYDAEGIHGDIAQNKREKVLKKFRDLKLNVLVATDVAARGIDVNDLTHVINHSLPNDVETYVHRIGRTGRAGKKGIAISFLSPKEKFMIKNIEKETKSQLTEQRPIQQKDIFAKKISKMDKEIEEIITSNDVSPYLETAKGLVSNHGELKTIAALMYKLQNSKAAQKKEESSKDTRFEGENTRLFIAKGKKDRITKRSLFEWLEKESKVYIDAKDVKICEKFSFITVPTEQARKITSAFKKNKNGRPLVEVASE